MNIKNYLDIGHTDPRDFIWIYREGGLEKVRAGVTWTHELLWGKEITQFWRGRFEFKTDFCSILPPEGIRYLPPQALRDLLTHNFPVFRFYFFVDGIPQEFDANPKI